MKLSGIGMCNLLPPIWMLFLLIMRIIINRFISPFHFGRVYIDNIFKNYNELKFSCALEYNKGMKNVKTAGLFILFAVLFLLCGKGFHYLLVDDTKSYTRVMMNEFYHQKNIDILFVGSSHCYEALDPAVTDEIFEANTFNAGSSLQAQDASFALIREAVERYDVKHVFFEMYYFMMSNDEYNEREQLTSTYIISDYMRPSLNKARFLLEASSPKYYVNSFLPARRNWERLLHPSEIRDLLTAKSEQSYKNFTPFGDYRTKGFVANQGSIPNGILLDTAGFDSIHVENASKDWLKTIRQIIEYCGKKDVRLTLFSSPMTLFQTAGVGNYDDYIAFIRELTAGSGVEYVDFNLCREEFFDQKTDYFSDAGHMNETGAQIFSRVFAEYFTGKITADELFYDSIAEKIAASGPQILGLSFLDSGDGMRKLKIVSTLPEGTLYSAALMTEDGTTQILKENDADPYFEIPQTEHGTIRISTENITAEVEV